MSKLIPLTQGLSAIVDDADYDWLSQWKWSASAHHGRHRVVRAEHIAGAGKSKMIRMHRLIMGAVSGQIVDHINRNPLDNRRSNLRFCTHAENQRNRAADKGSTSKFLGVSWDSDRGKWAAQISGGGKRHLGRFDCETAAALAYDRAAKTVFGEFAGLNFPS